MNLGFSGGSLDPLHPEEKYIQPRVFEVSTVGHSMPYHCQ